MRCSMNAVVLSDEIREVQKGDKRVAERRLTVHQSGERETIQVVVPTDSDYEKYQEYEFIGEYRVTLFKGQLYKKFIVESV